MLFCVLSCDHSGWKAITHPRFRGDMPHDGDTAALIQGRVSLHHWCLTPQHLHSAMPPTLYTRGVALGNKCHSQATPSQRRGPQSRLAPLPGSPRCPTDCEPPSSTSRATGKPCTRQDHPICAPPPGREGTCAPGLKKKKKLSASLTDEAGRGQVTCPKFTQPQPEAVELGIQQP